MKSERIEKLKRDLPPIIYEDEWIIAFDKPGGILVTPDPRDPKRGCLLHLVRETLAPEAFNVHRLDAETSGVVLFARNKSVQKTFSLLFERNEIRNLHLALVHGAPPETRMNIKTGLVKNPDQPGLMLIVPKGGMNAETSVSVINQWAGHSLLEVISVTGRTHQIRAHLVHIGCPIVADSLYGSGSPLLLSEIKRNYFFSRDRPETPLIGRLALHAASVSFKHPLTGAEIMIEAPMPKDFKIAVKYLDKFSGTNYIQPASN